MFSLVFTIFINKLIFFKQNVYFKKFAKIDKVLVLTFKNAESKKISL